MLPPRPPCQTHWFRTVITPVLVVTAVTLGGCTWTVNDESVEGDQPADTASAVQSGGWVVDGDYAYATDVAAQRLVLDDVCEFLELARVEPVDFATLRQVYGSGGSSSEGSTVTLASFASGQPAGDFVEAALDGTGIFEQTTSSVRAAAATYGLQNNVMASQMLAELEAAQKAAEAGDYDPLQGAIHHWDLAWASFYGVQPACAPWGAAEKQGVGFATLASGGVGARTNELIVAAMVGGRTALEGDNGPGATSAANEVRKQIWIIYSQAVIYYADSIDRAVGSGDLDLAAEFQADGLASLELLRTSDSLAQADTATLEAMFDLAAPPQAGDDQDTDQVQTRAQAARAALRPFWEAAGIDEADIGTLG